MSLDSLTHREIHRSVHFDHADKEAALSQARLLREQVTYYLDQIFGSGGVYLVERRHESETDHVYTIRKGSAVLSVRTIFGLDTSYAERPPRKFYTFTASASHHNETLDNTDKANEVIEWTFRAGGALVLGVIFTVLLLLFAGHLSGHLIFLGFAAGSALGGMVGQLISRKVYQIMERRLEARGEITVVEQEWQSLAETLDIVFSPADPAPAG